MITCEECGGECCKKFAVQIEAPKSMVDYHDIKWYLYHTGVIVYIDNEGDWLVQIPIKCEKLDKNGRCTIYDKRPPICRTAKLEECEKNTNEMAVVFKDVEALEKYMKKKKLF